MHPNQNLAVPQSLWNELGGEVISQENLLEKIHQKKELKMRENLYFQENFPSAEIEDEPESDYPEAK